MAETPPTAEPQFPGVVRRPPGQLHDFPVEVRWEVTRRNPFYQVFWGPALRYRRPHPDEHPAQTHLHHMAALILGAVGVFGEPVDPAKSFEELQAEAPDPSFLCGSVQPATLRAVAAMLLTTLPPAERAVVGALMTTSGLGGNSEAVQGEGRLRLAQALSELSRFSSPALDSVPDAPLFYVHLGASKRTIAADMESQARLWQSKRSARPAKVHTAKFADYLAVWDAREGWAAGAYDRGREHPFADIARERGVSISTVYGQYRSAFEAVVGVEFAPELWWRTLGKIKFSALFGGMTSWATARHRLRSPVPRPVPDSVLNPRDADGSGRSVVGQAATTDDAEFRDFILDLKELFAQNLTDQEIARRLDVADPGIIAELRARQADLAEVA